MTLKTLIKGCNILNKGSGSFLLKEIVMLYSHPTNNHRETQ